MYEFIPFLFFALFFILIIFVKDKKTLAKIVNVFLAIILGGLFIAGTLALLTGIFDALDGRFEMYDLLLQVIAGILFMTVGGGFFYFYFVAAELSLRRFERRQKQYPDAPWMWVDHWSNKRIVYVSINPLKFTWFVLTGLIGGLALVSYANREVILAKIQSHDTELIAFFLVLAFILIPCFAYGISLLRGHLKFGNSVFDMSTYPGVIGGKLEGAVHTRIRNIPADGFDLELRCGYQDLKSRSGNKVRETHTTRILWEATRKIPARDLFKGLYGVSVPVSFSIPVDAPESDGWSPDKRIAWTLLATASVEGARYSSVFDVPVFQVGKGQKSCFSSD